MRGGAVLLSCLVLAGCDGTFPEFPSFRGKASNQITVTQDQVQLVAPQGFCVDTESTRNGDVDAFVLFGNCAAISGADKQADPFVPAIVTASVTINDAGARPIGENAEQIKDFFVSDAGRRALSRSGEADSVKILDSFTREGAIYLHAEDTSPDGLSGAESTYWRGYFDANNSVIALSVIGLSDAPLDPNRGLATLEAFIATTRGESAPPTTKPPVIEPQQKPKPGGLRTGFLRRLFG